MTCGPGAGLVDRRTTATRQESAPAAEELTAGAMFDCLGHMLSLEKYALTEKIYEGLATVVYRGRRKEDGARVALKILKNDYPSPAEIERLSREHALLKSVDVPGIPRALGLEKHGGRLALAMEELPGRPLDDVLRSQRLDLPAVLRIGASLSGVLGRLHLSGVVHKDVKPQNILVRLDVGEASLVDLGAAAHLSQDAQELPGVVEGTLAYVAPEQTGRMNRRVDHRADLYSLGVTLYELLLGALPFTSTDPVELVHSHVARMPAPPHERDPSIPRVVSDIVLKLLSKSSEERYRTAFGLQADLEACLARLSEAGYIEPFSLGRREQCADLRLSDRLYGRDVERRAVLAAWERAGRGARELLLLAGPAGVGKSVLVEELRADILRRGGYFVAGKFDQLNHSSPYAPLEHAFRELVRRVLTEPSEVLEVIRARLVQALGPNGRIVADLVPDVEHIIGAQPPVPELGPTESQNRFNLVFQRFLAAFTAPDRPFTLFLDDLQWADPATLKLLGALMTDPESAHLLVLSAYRDGEVDDTHPLALALAQLRRSGVPVSVVPLAPLGEAEVAAFIADTLGCGAAQVEPLAALLSEKTGGNPFFVGQLLRGLFRDGLITFDASRGTLSWDLDAIRASTDDDVVAFVTDKLRALSPSAQRALELAACVGHRFDLETLSALLGQTPADVTRALEEAMHAGFVSPVEPDGPPPRATRFREEPPAPAPPRPRVHRFLHDRIQQAAYALIGEEQRRGVHLRIGRLLRARLGADSRDDELFAVVHHENLGAALIRDPEERLDLVRLNVAAARRAKAATAFAAASDYFDHAVALLDGTTWEREHERTFAIHAEQAECAYLCGRFEAAEALSQALLARARSLTERIVVERRRMELRATLGRFAEAVEIGLAVVGQLGIHIPDSEEARGVVLVRQLAEIDAIVGDRPVEGLLHEKTLANLEVETLQDLLMILCGAGYYVSPTAYALPAIELVILSLQHGHSPYSPVAYMAYAFVLTALLGQHRRAEAFGELALALQSKYPNPQTECKLHHMFGTFAHSCKPVRVALAHLERACSVGLELGDFAFLSYAADNSIPYKFALGMELSELRDDVTRLSALMQRTQDALSIAYLSVAAGLVDNLLGRTKNRLTLSSDSFEEAGFAESMVRAGLYPVACWFHVARLMVLFLHGDYEGALQAAARAQELVLSATGQYFPTELSFFACLAAAARRPSAAPDEARRCDELLARHGEKLAQWATHCPVNYQHKHLLVQAELARLGGRHDEATDAFDRAIEAAGAEGFARDEVIALERCALFHREKGRTLIARVYMAEAYAGYARWGATAKTAALSERFADLLPAPVAAPQKSAALVTTTTRLDASGLLDATALVRAAQALVGEVVLDRVIERLMRLVVESSGAQRGVLLLARDHQLLVTARLDQERIEVGPPLPLEQTADVAGTIVRYVARTGEPVILDDARHDHRFAADPYLTRRRPRSILCLAMTQNERLTGILYLENNAAGSAFTRARTDLSCLLASLAAAAVENALLYTRVDEVTQALLRANESLESEVSRRTEDLRATNAQLALELAERERAEKAMSALHEQIVRMQEERLAELSTPILPITDQIIVIPLIGTMDAPRGRQVLEAALSAVGSHRVDVVILDVTGMKMVDIEVADMLTATASALRLLGARALVTGLSPEIAGTLVERGAELGSMTTAATLKAAVVHALRELSAPAGRAVQRAGARRA